ncbi:MAG: hypothetical protein IJF23_04955 [Clostridia bacterium]|nr:hypothetical protein [Clostridia bacterium]
MKKALVLMLTLVIALSAAVCTFAYEPMFKETVGWREYLNTFEDFAEKYNAYRAAEEKDIDIEKNFNQEKAIITLYKFRFSKQAENDGMLESFNEEWKKINDSLYGEIKKPLNKWQQYLADFEIAAVKLGNAANFEEEKEYVKEFGRLYVMRGYILKSVPENEVENFLEEWTRIAQIAG